MNNLMRLNQAMEYIENNLTNEIDMKEVSRIALCSEFHFSKMFSYLAGMQLSEYVRKRKLTLAVSELKANLSIQDVAVKYNYSSADAFSRAFKKMHGILPSEARLETAITKTFPKLSFEINITGGHEMEYRIVEKEAFNLIGFKKRVTITHNGANEEITSMYKAYTPEVIAELKALSNVEPIGMLSASMNFVDRHLDGVGKLDHIIGVASTESSEKYDVTPIEASTYAVFTSCGPFPKTLQETWAKIYGQWFPSTNYVPTGGAEITCHATADMSDLNFKSEIWVPVKLEEK